MLMTNTSSLGSTVGGIAVTDCCGCFLGAIAVKIESTFSRGVMLTAMRPSISSSPRVHLMISSVQGDRRAIQLPSLPCRPDDRTSHAKVEYRVNTLSDLVAYSV
ncbi:hypothetical protein Pcac1_g7558 [Phytophthora cactorum]|nr:hypothetical protein Pcac1_g7558 [Phytophthora cactorum]